MTLCFVLCPFDFGVLTIHFCMLSSQNRINTKHNVTYRLPYLCIVIDFSVKNIRVEENSTLFVLLVFVLFFVLFF